jgi:multicomponent Na+:H+ antiporter subunit F
VNVAQVLAMVLLVAAAVIGIARVVRRSSLGDRAVALDALTAVIACALLIGASQADDGLMLDLAVLFGLMGFLASVTVARFIESRKDDQ